MTPYAKLVVCATICQMTTDRVVHLHNRRLSEHASPGLMDVLGYLGTCIAVSMVGSQRLPSHCDPT